MISAWKMQLFTQNMLVNFVDQLESLSKRLLMMNLFGMKKRTIMNQVIFLTNLNILAKSIAQIVEKSGRVIKKVIIADI